MKQVLKSIMGAAALSFAAIGASAATYYYSDFVTGDSIGLQNVAVLTATQNGSDVDFSLLNSVSGNPSAFIAQIAFAYGGTLPTDVEEIAGTEAGIEGIGSQGLGNVLTFDFGVQIDNSGSPQADRLEVGETALFKVKDVQLSLFDFTPPDAGGVHIQGLNGGGSAKYTIGDCVGPDCNGGGLTPVPVPASLPLLLGALGIGGFALKRRKRNA